MIRPFPSINIQQVTPFQYKDEGGTLQVKRRNRLIQIDFVTEFEIESGWEAHCDKSRITFPKNIILIQGEKLFYQTGTYNVILGGGDSSNLDAKSNKITAAPLIMRGDIVYVSTGHIHKNELRKDIQVGNTIFTGFVTSVNSDVPIQIECEDMFSLLKRVPLNKPTWTGNIIDLCKYGIDLVNSSFAHNKDHEQLMQVGYEKNGNVSVPTYELFNPYPELSIYDKTDKTTLNFSLGHLDIGDITFAQLLAKLKSQYHLDSFFVGNVLHFGMPIYREDEANSTHVFEFQNNISEHDLEYKNKGDIELSAVVSTFNIRETGRQTKDGEMATKKEALTILIYWDLPTESFKMVQKKKGEKVLANTGGERRRFFMPFDPTKENPSVEQLFNFGKAQLEKYYYTGFYGSFTSILFPFVQWNDNVNLIDNVLSDRNGQYKVKKVIYRGGAKVSFSQEIFLDFKFNGKIAKSFKTVYMI